MSEKKKSHKPGPTAAEASNRIIRLIVLVIATQFFLSGLEQVLDGLWMLFIWFGAGGVVALATYQIESYFDRRRRFLE